MKTVHAIVMALSVAMLGSGAHASDRDARPVKATTQADFDAVAADVRKEMEGGGRYAYVRPEERAKVDAGLARMRALFEQAQSVERMSGEQKITLFNAQETVNAILAQRDRDRLVCERGAQTGSRIISTRCRTYGEIEAEREASRTLMQQKLPAPCSAKPCSGQ